jgi:hypothetical protein
MSEANPNEPYEPATPALCAIASDASSLDVEHPLNARFRDQGIGLVPRVLQVDVEAKSATLGAAAIMCTFDVPLGWHVTDDAKRTLVFDAEGTTQINLNLRKFEGDLDTMLASIEREAKSEQADLITTIMEVETNKALLLCNLRVNDETLCQAYWPRAVAPNLYLTARVTAPTPPSELMPRAMNVAEVIMRSAKYVGG